MKKLILFLVLLITQLSFAAGWSSALHVGANATGASGSSRAVTITSTTGTVIEAVAMCSLTGGGTAPTISSISDTKSNSYQRLKLGASSGHSVDIWIALSATTAVTTITMTMSGTCNAFLDGYAADFTPPVGSSLAIDGTGNSASGNSTSAATGTATITGNNDLFLAAAITPTTSSVNNGFTLDSTTDGNCLAHLSNGTTSIGVICTTTSGNWLAAIGAISATGAATTSQPSKREKLEAIDN